MRDNLGLLMWMLFAARNSLQPLAKSYVKLLNRRHKASHRLIRCEADIGVCLGHDFSMKSRHLGLALAMGMCSSVVIEHDRPSILIDD